MINYNLNKILIKYLNFQLSTLARSERSHIQKFALDRRDIYHTKKSKYIGELCE